VCARNCHDPKRNTLQNAGERYPFTRDGWRRAWAEALVEAKIEDFRFHDLRHTAATRAQGAVGNLKTVQRMLGHKDIKTTLRYIRSDVADVRAAMEAVEKATLGPRVVGEEEKKESGSSA
jgi:integrase